MWDEKAPLAHYNEHTREHKKTAGEKTVYGGI
jgi:hypothetical protein